MFKKLFPLFLVCLFVSGCRFPGLPEKIHVPVPEAVKEVINSTGDTGEVYPAPVVTEPAPVVTEPAATIATCDPNITGCQGDTLYTEEGPGGEKDAWYQEGEGAVPWAGAGIDPGMPAYAPCMDKIEKLFVGQPEPSRDGMKILPSMVWDPAIGGWRKNLGNGFSVIFPGTSVANSLMWLHPTNKFDPALVELVKTALSVVPCTPGK